MTRKETVPKPKRGLRTTADGITERFEGPEEPLRNRHPFNRSQIESKASFSSEGRAGESRPGHKLERLRLNKSRERRFSLSRS